MAEKKIIFGVILIVALGLLATTFMPRPEASTYDTKLQLGESEVRVEIARTFFEKYRGLSGRESMCNACGMLFVFDEAAELNFVMRDMRFNLDFVFLRDNEVVEIYTNIKAPLVNGLPARIRSSANADTVLELNAGTVMGEGIELGDQMTVDVSS